MLIWLAPALAAFFLYGLGQGLVKKTVGDVSPARFCLYFVIARSLVALAYTALYPDLDLGAAGPFMGTVVLVYLLDGLGWIFYYRSIVSGPISIVGTLSAAYPALTVLLASCFLGERLQAAQYIGVTLVLTGCLGLSYSPDEPTQEGTLPVRRGQWMPQAAAALICWGCGQTLLKYAYRLPAASEPKAMLGMLLGGWLTLGVFGWRGTRGEPVDRAGALSAVLPMGMMAAGDAAVIVATRSGPVSVVAPLTAAYPLVTIAFARLFLHEQIGSRQWLCVLSTLVGMLLATR